MHRNIYLIYIYIYIYIYNNNIYKLCMTCTKMSKHIYQKQNTYFSTIYISCFLIYICDENNSTKANGVSLVVTYNPAFKNFS